MYKSVPIKVKELQVRYENTWWDIVNLDIENNKVEFKNVFEQHSKSIDEVEIHAAVHV